MDEQNTNRGESLGPYGKAITTIHAFRSNYLDFDSDLSAMATLGIKYVRVPVSWCWTDFDPEGMITEIKIKGGDSDDENFALIYMSDEEVKEKLTCEDPFYSDVRWPASEYSSPKIIIV